MATTRFHKAAQDGLIEILKEATKKDCNIKDEDGMTPTLWAAHNGHLDALRLLAGRGGDIEKANYYFGQTALHLAAAKGHLNCVSFLVGFDANLWALDHDFHTPMQLASSKEVLDYLDKAVAKQEHTSKKEVKSKKEKAMKDAERRRKKYEERIKKEKDKEEKRYKKVEKEFGIARGADSDGAATITSSRNQVIESSGPTFTQIVGTGTMNKKPSSVKTVLEKKLKHSEVKENEHKEKSNGNKKEGQIIYVNSFENQNNGKRGRINDVFSGQVEVTNNAINQQSSIFDRPGFGSVAFRQRSNLAGTLSGSPDDAIEEKDNEDSTESIGSAGSLAKRNQQIGWQHDDMISDDETFVANGQSNTLQRFLASAGVEEYAPQLMAQRIDLDAVLMLSDADLTELGIPMGPRRKLLYAVEQRKHALKEPGVLQDTKL